MTQAEQSGGPDTGGARVLIADDHDLIAQLLRRVFEDAGHEVSVETRPDDVAEKVARERPDLVLVDIQMSPRDPFYALESLRHVEVATPPAVIAVSGDDSPWVSREAVSLGADAFLRKPWDEEELASVTGRLLAERAAD